ncbi:MAG TPA: DUF2868 domain-containing protein [Prosthecobacter sp.]|nr:DUF2868 domain-containing protein [Prosthecobacter sp.]
MKWNDWQGILRWRAMEEADADGALLSLERRQEATARTRGGLSSWDAQGGALNEREAAFLKKRAEWLEREVIGWGSPVARVMERLRAPHGRWSWALCGWAAAFAAGWGLSGLGQEAEFNLLALPLVGLLLWNAVVMIAALVLDLHPAGPAREPEGLLAWLARLVMPRSEERAAEGETVTGLTADQRFALLANLPALERLCRRLRAWLHIAAAVLALGGVCGMYARGWSKEYRAVWESTLLDEAKAVGFFDALFSPAAAVWRLEKPLQDLPAMRRGHGQETRPAPALPWLHLYAGTLILLVALPRLALAGLSAWRAHAVMERRLRALGWRGYLERALRAAEGGGEVVTVIIHATDATPAHREVWARGVRERHGALVEPEMVHVPLGDEDDFASSWQPASSKVLVIFNLATTPEAEVQRRFVDDLRNALRTRRPDAELAVLLDATSIGNRWSPEKKAGRERLWTEMLEGVADEVIIAAKRGG